MQTNPIFSNQTYTIRDASVEDIDDIYILSALLNTINLPADKAELEQVIALSERSFSLQETDYSKHAYLFVLTDAEDRVIGTSQIFAKHGILSSPHNYFQVDLDERYSETLKKYFRHKTLRLCQSFDGPIEVGSLVLHKQYRNQGRLGTFLSYVRFLFIAMRREFFADHVIAELLPPLGENFASVFWEAIGRNFTGLDYYEADMISRTNKEFIKSLFPRGEIYVSLLPKDAQAVIGQVGEASKGAAHLLSRIGFRYSNRVDPFDGGPHFEADVSDISLIKNAVLGQAYAQTVGEKLGLCARFSPTAVSGKRFKAIVSPFDYGEQKIVLPKNALQKLDAIETDEVWGVGF